MTRADVYQVLGPHYEAQAKTATEHLRLAEKIILQLRRLLIARDPTLPNEYDGTAWAKIEQVTATSEPSG